MLTNLIKTIFGLVIIILLFFAIWNPVWSNGDEVHYLLLTNSIIADKDFDLRNNYENKDYFTHHAHPEGMHAFEGRNGTLMPYHGVLLSIAVIPGFYADNLSGSRVNVLVYTLIGIYFLYLLLKELGFSKNTSLITLSLFLVQAPILFLSSSIYPDLLMGFMLVIVAYLSLMGIKTRNNYYLLAGGIVSGINIFFHWKILAFSLLLFGATLLITFKKDSYYFLFDEKQSLSFKKLLSSKYSTQIKIIIDNLKTNRSEISKRIIFGLLPILFFTFLASLLSYIWFGHFRPDYMTPFLKDNPAIKGYANPFYNLTAMLFDSDQGLLWSGPILALIIPGLVLWYKNNKHTLFAFALPSIIFLLTQSLFKDWTAGWSPMARYTMSSLPLLVPALAYTLIEARKSKILATVVTGLTLINLIYLLIIIKFDYTGYPNSDINFFLQQILEKIGFNSLLDLITLNFNTPTIKEFIASILIYFWLIFCGIYLAYFDRKKPV